MRLYTEIKFGKEVYYMLMKIGDITKKLGVSHRSLHYWEDRGIIYN